MQLSHAAGVVQQCGAGWFAADGGAMEIEWGGRRADVEVRRDCAADDSR
jgi:hypothetical protein